MMRAGRTSEDADSEQFRSVVPQFDFLDLSRDRCSAFSASFSYCFTSRSILAQCFGSLIGTLATGILRRNSLLVRSALAGFQLAGFHVGGALLTSGASRHFFLFPLLHLRA